MPSALELITEFPHAYGRALAVAPDGARWATCDGLRVQILDAAGAVVAEVASPGETLFALVFAADGSVLFAAPRALDVASGEWLATADPGEAIAADLGSAAVRGYAVHDAAVSPDGLLVVRAEFRPSRAPGGEPFTGPTQRVLAFAAATLGRRVVLWEGAGSAVGALAAGPGLIAAALGAISVWGEDGAAIASLAGPSHATVTALAFAADGGLVACGDADGTVAAWTLPAGEEVARTGIHAGHVRAVAVHPDGHRVVSCGEDGRIVVSSLTGQVLAETHAGGAVEALALAPSGDRVYVSSARPTPFVRTYAL